MFNNPVLLGRGVKYGSARCHEAGRSEDSNGDEGGKRAAGRGTHDEGFTIVTNKKLKTSTITWADVAARVPAETRGQRSPRYNAFDSRDHSLETIQLVK